MPCKQAEDCERRVRTSEAAKPGLGRATRCGGRGAVGATSRAPRARRRHRRISTLPFSPLLPSRALAGISVTAFGAFGAVSATLTRHHKQLTCLTLRVSHRAWIEPGEWLNTSELQSLIVELFFLLCCFSRVSHITVTHGLLALSARPPWLPNNGPHRIQRREWGELFPQALLPRKGFGAFH